MHVVVSNGVACETMHVVTGFSGFASFLDFSHMLKFFRTQLVLPLVFSGINPLANSDSCCSEEN